MSKLLLFELVRAKNSDLQNMSVCQVQSDNAGIPQCNQAVLGR